MTMRAPDEAITPSPARSEKEHIAASGKQYPAVGGHLGLAVPIVTFQKHSAAQNIGSDFVKLGASFGTTIHLDEHWAIDFELIAYNDVKTTANGVGVLIDPGVVRKFENFNLGLRVATNVAVPANVALIPAIIVPFRISSTLAYYIEADVPVGVANVGGTALFNLTFQIQTGFAF